MTWTQTNEAAQSCLLMNGRKFYGKIVAPRVVRREILKTLNAEERIRDAAMNAVTAMYIAGHDTEAERLERALIGT